MNSADDTSNLEKFLKPVTKIATVFILRIPRLQFIKYLQSNTWYDRFHKSTNGYLGNPPELYLAWENEKLRNKVESLEDNIKYITEKLENIEYNLRLESLNSRLENLHDTTTTNKNKLYLAWENEWLRKKVEELSK